MLFLLSWPVSQNPQLTNPSWATPRTPHMARRKRKQRQKGPPSPQKETAGKSTPPKKDGKKRTTPTLHTPKTNKSKSIAEHFLSPAEKGGVSRVSVQDTSRDDKRMLPPDDVPYQQVLETQLRVVGIHMDHQAYGLALDVLKTGVLALARAYSAPLDVFSPLFEPLIDQARALLDAIISSHDSNASTLLTSVATVVAHPVRVGAGLDARVGAKMVDLFSSVGSELLLHTYAPDLDSVAEHFLWVSAELAGALALHDAHVERLIALGDHFVNKASAAVGGEELGDPFVCGYQPATSMYNAAARVVSAQSANISPKVRDAAAHALTVVPLSLLQQYSDGFRVALEFARQLALFNPQSQTSEQTVTLATLVRMADRLSNASHHDRAQTILCFAVQYASLFETLLPLVFPLSEKLEKVSQLLYDDSGPRSLSTYLPAEPQWIRNRKIILAIRVLLMAASESVFGPSQLGFDLDLSSDDLVLPPFAQLDRDEDMVRFIPCLVKHWSLALPLTTTSFSEVYAYVNSSQAFHRALAARGKAFLLHMHATGMDAFLNYRVLASFDFFGPSPDTFALVATSSLVARELTPVAHFDSIFIVSGASAAVTYVTGLAQLLATEVCNLGEILDVSAINLALLNGDDLDVHIDSTLSSSPPTASSSSLFQPPPHRMSSTTPLSTSTSESSAFQPSQQAQQLQREEQEEGEGEGQPSTPANSKKRHRRRVSFLFATPPTSPSTPRPGPLERDTLTPPLPSRRSGSPSRSLMLVGGDDDDDVHGFVPLRDVDRGEIGGDGCEGDGVDRVGGGGMESRSGDRVGEGKIRLEGEHPDDGLYSTAEGERRAEEAGGDAEGGAGGGAGGGASARSSSPSLVGARFVQLSGSSILHPVLLSGASGGPDSGAQTLYEDFVGSCAESVSTGVAAMYPIGPGSVSGRMLASYTFDRNSRQVPALGMIVDEVYASVVGPILHLLPTEAFPVTSSFEALARASSLGRIPPGFAQEVNRGLDIVWDGLLSRGLMAPPSRLLVSFRSRLSLLDDVVRLAYTVVLPLHVVVWSRRGAELEMASKLGWILWAQVLLHEGAVHSAMEHLLRLAQEVLSMPPAQASSPESRAVLLAVRTVLSDCYVYRGRFREARSQYESACELLGGDGGSGGGEETPHEAMSSTLRPYFDALGRSSPGLGSKTAWTPLRETYISPVRARRDIGGLMDELSVHTLNMDALEPLIREYFGMTTYHANHGWYGPGLEVSWSWLAGIERERVVFAGFHRAVRGSGAVDGSSYVPKVRETAGRLIPGLAAWPEVVQALRAAMAVDPSGPLGELEEALVGVLRAFRLAQLDFLQANGPRSAVRRTVAHYAHALLSRDSDESPVTMLGASVAADSSKPKVDARFDVDLPGVLDALFVLLTGVETTEARAAASGGPAEVPAFAVFQEVCFSELVALMIHIVNGSHVLSLHGKRLLFSAMARVVPGALCARLVAQIRLLKEFTELYSVSMVGSGGELEFRAQSPEAIEAALRRNTDTAFLRSGCVAALETLVPGVAPPHALVRTLLDGMRRRAGDRRIQLYTLRFLVEAESGVSCVESAEDASLFFKAMQIYPTYVEIHSLALTVLAQVPPTLLGAALSADPQILIQSLVQHGEAVDIVARRGLEVIITATPVMEAGSWTRGGWDVLADALNAAMISSDTPETLTELGTMVTSAKELILAKCE